jgi:hypothetical protein
MMNVFKRVTEYVHLASEKAIIGSFRATNINKEVRPSKFFCEKRAFSRYFRLI